MLTRFRNNVALYPRLFMSTVIGLVITLSLTYGVCRLAGIDPHHSGSVVGGSVLVCTALDILIAAWIMSNSARLAVFFSVINLIEGRKPLEFEEEQEFVDQDEENDDSEEQN